MPERKNIVVVGAGLSGLCCARTLQRAGYSAHLYEATGGVGGRVRTDMMDGFRLDRGFQALFTAYPAVRQELDLTALKLRRFDPSVVIYQDGERYPFGDPIRRPLQLLSTGGTRIVPFRDKLRLLRMRLAIRRISMENIFTLPDKTIDDDLRADHFSDAFVNQFARPLFGGIFMEHSLYTSVRMFSLVWKVLVEGRVAVPEKGMGAIGRQIGRGLQEGSLHLNAPVAGLIRTDAGVTGIRLQDGEEALADRVVIATAADVAAKLTGLKLPQEHRSCTCLYYAVPRLYRGRKMLLFAEPNKYAGDTGPLVNSAALMSNVAPSYAPPGKHLLSVTVLGIPPGSDAALSGRVIAEIAPHFPHAPADKWQLLQIYRIPWAQFMQPVGFFDRRPAHKTGIPGLILAGEITHSSSMHGALIAGQEAAAEAMREA